MDTPFGTATRHLVVLAHFSSTRTDRTGGMGGGGNTHLPLEFFVTAIGALRNQATAHQKLEILVTLGTVVFVQGH